MGDQQSTGQRPDSGQERSGSIFSSTVRTEKGKDVTPPPTSRNAEDKQRDARTD